MFIFRLLMIIFIIVSCSTAPKKAKVKNNSEILNLNVKKVVLENGLRVIIYENNKLPIFSYYTFFDVGGRYESREDGTTGATHFLEHMMFKGAKKYGPGKFDSMIEGNGGSTNAYTTFDSTVYYESLPIKSLNTIIDLEADRMQNLLLMPDAFEKERKVVFEERKYRYENRPSGKLFLKMMQTVFEGTPYGGSVIGEVEDLKALTRDQMMQFFKRFYVPNNAVVVIAGDVNADDVIEEMKDKFGEIPFSKELAKIKSSRDNIDLYEHRFSKDINISLHGSSPVPMFSMAYKGVPLGHRKAYVMDILSSILGDGQSSYFVQKYVKSKKPVLNRISVGNYNLKYNGVFFLNGELLKGVSLKRFKANLKKDIKKVCDQALDSRNLQKTKNQYMFGFYNAIKTNAGVASFLGTRENFFGDYSYYKKEIDIYKSIQFDELKQVCQEVFNDERVFISLWNKHSK